MSEDNSQNKKSAKIFSIIVGSIIFIIGWIINLLSPDDKSENKNAKDNNYYIGDTLSYKDIDLTVNNIRCIQNIDLSSEEYGLYYITVSITYKNNTKKEFDVHTSDVYIKTTDKGEKYNCSGFSGDKGFIDALLGETIIAGATKHYDISFYTAYSLETKKYIMCFDWGVFSREQEYHLYLRNNN